MRRKTIIAAAFTVALGALASPALGGQGKVTLCHAAGLEGTTKYVELTVGYPAAYGPAGHFFENGTTRAGHEQDYLGACEVPATTTSTTVPVTSSTTTTEAPVVTTTTTEVPVPTTLPPVVTTTTLPPPWCPEGYTLDPSGKVCFPVTESG